MYLSYVDDSDTKSKLHKEKWQVMSAVMIDDQDFAMLEMLMGSSLESLIPAEKLDSFTEFKACELFGGYGVFEGIPDEKRFRSIESLLSMLGAGRIPVVFGAVDLQSLGNTVYGSATPKDIAFRICVEGIDWHIIHNFGRSIESLRNLNQFALLIADECEGHLKKMLQHTFRSLRKRVKPPDFGMGGKVYYFHDDMYFGDSKFSVGLQLADLCSYIITRHLCGDKEIDEFYDLIEPSIVYNEIVPDGEKAYATHRTIPEVRSGNGGTPESSPQRDKEEIGRGKRGKAETEGE